MIVVTIFVIAAVASIDVIAAIVAIGLAAIPSIDVAIASLASLPVPDRCSPQIGWTIPAIYPYINADGEDNSLALGDGVVR